MSIFEHLTPLLNSFDSRFLGQITVPSYGMECLHLYHGVLSLVCVKPVSVSSCRNVVRVP